MCEEVRADLATESGRRLYLSREALSDGSSFWDWPDHAAVSLAVLTKRLLPLQQEMGISPALAALEAETLSPFLPMAHFALMVLSYLAVRSLTPPADLLTMLETSVFGPPVFTRRLLNQQLEEWLFAEGIENPDKATTDRLSQLTLDAFKDEMWDCARWGTGVRPSPRTTKTRAERWLDQVQAAINEARVEAGLGERQDYVLLDDPVDREWRRSNEGHYWATGWETERPTPVSFMAADAWAAKTKATVISRIESDIRRHGLSGGELA